MPLEPFYALIVPRTPTAPGKPEHPIVLPPVKPEDPPTIWVPVFPTNPIPIYPGGSPTPPTPPSGGPHPEHPIVIPPPAGETPPTLPPGVPAHPIVLPPGSMQPPAQIPGEAGTTVNLLGYFPGLTPEWHWVTVAATGTTPAPEPVAK